MTRNQFLKLTGLKGCHRRYINLFLDIIRQYKGKLSYLELWIYGEYCFLIGIYRVSDIKWLIGQIMQNKEVSLC